MGVSAQEFAKVNNLCLSSQASRRGVLVSLFSKYNASFFLSFYTSENIFYVFLHPALQKSLENKIRYCVCNAL
jgi:hypothetical protein